MDTPWISEQGVFACDGQGAVTEQFTTFLAAQTQADATYYMAQGVSEFCVGSVSVTQGNVPCFIPPLPAAQPLLELRVFGQNTELWLHRTTLDAPFVWRLADDAVLTRSVAQAQPVFLQDPNHYRLPQMQYCSIDRSRTTKPPQKDADGRQVLHAIGGRQYELPAPEGCDCVIVIQYLSYHVETAQAIPMDYRFAGFGCKNDMPKRL